MAAKPTGGDASDSVEAACLRALSAGGVAFRQVPHAKAIGIAYPLELDGPLDGVTITGARKRSPTNFIDCRLAEALLDWASALRARGVAAIEHYSIYRKAAQVAGTSKPSAHAAGLAIDAARFHMDDGRVLSVLDDWQDKTLGADPCAERPTEAEAGELLRGLVCDAARQGLFQIIVTPNHDAAHFNHVHLELAENRGYTWIK
jgi:hypothetical protein